MARQRSQGLPYGRLVVPCEPQPFGQPDARQAALRLLAGSLGRSGLGRRLPQTLYAEIR